VEVAPEGYTVCAYDERDADYVGDELTAAAKARAIRCEAVTVARVPAVQEVSIPLR
jgi:hypothetical protein